MRHTMANPMEDVANGIPAALTFIPYKPEMMVGMAITIVMDVRYFITLFKRRSIIVDTSSRVLLMMSR